MLIENLKKVEQIWQDEDLKIAPPLSKSVIIESFAHLNKMVSQDVIEACSNLGGMIDDIDSVCFSFWRIEEILSENKPDSELIFFADFLVYSHLYGFRFENSRISSVHIYWGENQTEQVANSFDEFFENYLMNHEKYLLFSREN